MGIKRLAAVLVALGSAAALWSDAGSLGDPEIRVYKSPTCGCCAKWIEHMRGAGFRVVAEDVSDMREVKRREGVPLDLASCHTAVVEGYVVEGHVPGHVVRSFLEAAPAVAGLAVPGMPVGSPGMEGPNPQSYDVVAFDGDGNRTVFERVER